METEKDARKKWCPMTGDHAGVVGGRCLANECMWWQWTGTLDRGKDRYGYCGHVEKSQ